MTNFGTQDLESAGERARVSSSLDDMTLSFALTNDGCVNQRLHTRGEYRAA